MKFLLFYLLDDSKIIILGSNQTKTWGEGDVIVENCAYWRLIPDCRRGKHGIIYII